MSARNGDKSRFHRLRKAKIRRRLRTELLHSMVTTKQELPAAHATDSAPSGSAQSEPAPSEPAPTADKQDAHPKMGPLAAAAKTFGSTLGSIVSKTTHTHKDSEYDAQPTE